MANKHEYKGDIPSNLVGKEGALKTQLMVMKGKKLEAQENKQDTTDFDVQIAQLEADQVALEKTIANLRNVA